MSQHHDPVHPDSDHLSVELIADLDEGLLDPESTAHAEQHLGHCATCRGIRDQLQAVTASLAALPAVSMPSDVLTRLTAAFSGSANAGVTDISSARSRRHGSTLGRSLGVAASVAAVLLIGGLLYPAFVRDDPQGSQTAEGGPTPQSASTDTIELASYSATTSGTEYQTDTLVRQVDQLVTTSEGDGGKGTTTAVTTAPTESFAPSQDPTLPEGPLSRALKAALSAAVATDPEAARQCIQEYLQSRAAPLAIDVGTFDGRPAAIVVLPAPGGGPLAEVWVLDPSCGGSSPVLHWQEVPLP